MANLNKKKIAIIEPSPVIRRGMKDMLEENARFTVAGIYCDVHSFRKAKGDKSFDIILINPAVVNFHRQFAVRNLFPEYSNTVIVAILSGYVDSETLAGFDSVLSIYDDSAKMSRKLRQTVKSRIIDRNKTDNVDLSDREREILVSIAQGLTNKEIADKHFISVHTVVSHRKSVSRKTGIKTIAGLTLYATFNNLISQED